MIVQKCMDSCKVKIQNVFSGLFCKYSKPIGQIFEEKCYICYDDQNFVYVSRFLLIT